MRVTSRAIVVIIATFACLHAPTRPAVPLGQMIKILTATAMPLDHVQHPVDLAGIGKLFGITPPKP
jgi:hypothetical protein